MLVDFFEKDDIREQRRLNKLQNEINIDAQSEIDPNRRFDLRKKRLL